MSGCLLWLTVLFSFCLIVSGPRPALLGVLLPCLVFGSRCFLRLRKSRALLAASKKKYGFWVATGGTQAQGIFAATPSRLQAAAGVIAVEAALDRYPSSFLAACGVRRLVLCRHLRLAGVRDGFRRQAGGCCNLGTGVVYLNLAPSVFLATLCQGIDGSAEAFLTRSLHHEFFHLFDWQTGHWQDEAWAGLNPPGFCYTDSVNDIPNEPRRGFVTGYAAAAVQEDKAELFSFLMVDYPKVRREMACDPVLRAKVTRLKGMLRRCCPEMDEAFWH